MANFQYFVHRVSGIVADITATNNLPEGGFYSLDRAYAFAEIIKDGRNFVILYTPDGKLFKNLGR